MKSFINILLSIALLSIITSVLLQPFVVAEDYEVVPASNFYTTDERGVNFSLSDYKGDVIILHFTGLETPLCIECLDEMKGQIRELESFSQLKVNTTIITINIRKNQYSDSGMMMAESDFGVNVDWHWVEDYSPYPIAGLYQEYWTVDGAFSNPTLLLINQNFSIVGVYHVYCLGKGPLDGIQTANSLSKDISDIQSGDWKGFKGSSYSEGITFLGMFALGILTAATPCSIALLIAMISYVGSLQGNSDKKLKKLSLQGFWIGIFFTIGMSLVFFIFGLIISSLGLFLEISALWSFS